MKFPPPRERLHIAEVEFETEEEMNAFVPPPWVDVIAEVTHDVRFTGGRYLTMDEADVDALLKSVSAF